MNRRDAFRAAALSSVGILTQISAPNESATQLHGQLHDKLIAKGAAPWKPSFFSEAQNETVTIIAELIIPETDTPGARAAKVNEHIDLVMSEETREVQEAFLAGLNWIDARSRDQFGSNFNQISGDQQSSILATLAAGKIDPRDELGKQFFEDIKRRTTFAYYTSEIGIHQELKYKGNAVLSEWTGCPHPDHHGDSDS